MVGKADLVEFREGIPYPVEYKHGPARHGRHADLQLCGQAMCLEEMLGATISHGAVYHFASHSRREVAFTAELRRSVELAVAAIREIMRSDHLPAPVADSRCRNCSLVDSCLPSSCRPRTKIGTTKISCSIAMSRNRLHRCRKSEPASGRGLRHCADQRRNIVARELLNTLYVTTQGAYVHADHETLRVEAGDETILRVPVHHLGSVVCFGRVSVSPEAMARCAADQRDLVFLSRGGRFRAKVIGPTSGNVLLRLAQHQAHQDTAWAVDIARNIVAAKIQNARLLLMRGSSPNRRRRVGNGIERRRQRNGQRHTIPSQVRQYG